MKQLLLFFFLSLVSPLLSFAISDESIQPPDSVVLASPAHRALDIVYSNNFLEWFPSSNASTYRILLTLDEQGSDTVVYEGNLGTTFYILPALLENTVYYWKVRGENSGGAGKWSEVRKFRTAIPDGEALVITLNNTDSLIGYVALNTQTRWNGNFFYSKVKSLSQDGTVVFTEQDFPALFAQDFMVRRIDFIGLDGRTLIGHLMINYLFTSNYPRTPRKDILAYFHKNRKISPEIFPFWRYYTATEIPVTGLIPPSNRLQSVRPIAAQPVLLVNGLGENDWERTSEELFPNNLDAWQFLYPYSSPIDSSAVLLARAVDVVSSYYITKKRVGIAAHSSGGLVARAMIQRNDYKENVSKVLLLGTPNYGSYLCYKRFYSDELNGIGNEFVQGLEQYSPLLAEISPASSFLFSLNALPPKKLYPNSDITKTYLSVAGTVAMPLGLFHNEIASEEDGVVSIASAGLLGWNIPLATVSLAHAPIYSEDTSKNLLRNSHEILRGFFGDSYSPTSLPLSLELAVDGFWLRQNFTIKSDNRFLPGKSIAEIFLPDIREDGFTVRSNSVVSTLTIARASLNDNRQTLGLLRIPETNNYFAAYPIGKNALGLSMPTSPQTIRIADWIGVTDSRLFNQERIIPLSCSPSTLKFQPLETTMSILSPRSPIMKSWFLGVERRQEIQLATSVRDTIMFDVDTYMDTMVIARFLPIDTIISIQTIPNSITTVQSFRLIAPNGVVIDTTISPKSSFLPYSGIGYENFTSDNVSYYFMAQPQPGRWKILTEKSPKGQFVQSYLSEVALRISVNDSLYKPNDSVPFRVLLPKNFYSNPKLTVRVFAPTNDTTGTAITLRQSDSSVYEYSGVFFAQTIGIYRIAADFSCNFAAGPIHRTTSKSIEIIDALPTIPTLLLPVNNDTNVACFTVLSWLKDSRATAYQIQCSAKQKFTELIADTLVTDAPLLALPRLIPLTKYYWRVRASNRRGWTPWSEPFIFRTNSLTIASPILKSPISGTVTPQQVVTLSWIPSFKAERCCLQISRDSLFKTAIVYDSLKENASFPFAMQSNTLYYWRVRAVSADNSESEWSQIWNFKRSLPSPIPILPENRAVNLPLNIRLKWYSPDISFRFKVEIATKPDFSDIVFTQTTLGDTIMYAAVPSNFTTFYWHVKWLFSDGSGGDWSEVWSFTTMLAKPRLDSPGDKVTGVNLNPTLTWNSVPGGVYYHLQLSKDSDFTQKIFEDSMLLVIAKPLKELPPLTYFYWRVRSRIASGGSDWSDVWSFKTGEQSTAVEDALLNDYSVCIAPQPASGISFVELQLPESTEVTVSVIDLLGRVVMNVPRSNFEAGGHHIPLIVPSKGIYYCRITIGSQVLSKIFVY
jgi:hypothetical protein